MSGVWKTKFGPRRVRHDPPTLPEAIEAASGLTDDLQQQVEIAASLMAMPTDEVRVEVMKAAAQRKARDRVMLANRGGATRAVVVERKPTRRPAMRNSSGR